MKKIEAFIKSYRLNDVTRALHCVEGLTGMTITDARGLGRGGVDQCEYKPSEKLGIFQSIIRIEVFCRDELADTVVSTIEKAAHTGLRGDGCAEGSRRNFVLANAVQQDEITLLDHVLQLDLFGVVVAQERLHAGHAVALAGLHLRR